MVFGLSHLCFSKVNISPNIDLCLLFVREWCIISLTVVTLCPRSSPVSPPAFRGVSVSLDNSSDESSVTDYKDTKNIGQCVYVSVRFEFFM